LEADRSPLERYVSSPHGDNLGKRGSVV